MFGGLQIGELGFRIYNNHPVNLLLGHGLLIHELSGSGKSRAWRTVSQPACKGIICCFPLRLVQRNW